MGGKSGLTTLFCAVYVSNIPAQVATDTMRNKSK